jgi:hypothetical protein
MAIKGFSVLLLKANSQESLRVQLTLRYSPNRQQVNLKDDGLPACLNGVLGRQFFQSGEITDEVGKLDNEHLPCVGLNAPLDGYNRIHCRTKHIG